jgi:hypothetical protein
MPARALLTGRDGEPRTARNYDRTSAASPRTQNGGQLGVIHGPDKEWSADGLARPTQDGRIGLVVNRVYAGSPAARMGLAEGDVLLKLVVPGAPWPIELATHEGDGSEMPDFDEADIPKEFAAMGMQMPRRRPWPSQDNYLNQLLGDVGQGTTVKLRSATGPRLLEKKFTIHGARADQCGQVQERLG